MSNIWSLKDIEILNVEFDKENVMFSFDAHCGCDSVTMKASEIPLEDLSCPCGKTKFIRIIWQRE